MFPIPWNKTYRKKDGSLVNIDDAISGGGSGSDIPEHSASDAGKVLTVADDGTLEWHTGGAGGGLYRGTTPPAASLGSDGDVYIQSYTPGIISNSGEGYVKTGVKPNAGYTIKVSVKTNSSSTNYETIFGTRNSNYSRFTARFTNTPNGALGAQWSNGAGHTSSNTTDYPSLTKGSMASDFTEVGLQYMGYMLVDGKIVARNGSSSVANYDPFPYEWYLLALNDADTSSDYLVGSIEYCKIYDEDDDVVAFLVPAMNEEIPTMYDLLSGTFCDSENTSDLTVTLSNEEVEGLYWTKVSGSWVVVTAR